MHLHFLQASQGLLTCMNEEIGVDQELLGHILIT